MLTERERSLLKKMRTKKEEIKEEEEGDIYTNEGISTGLDDDGITPQEQAFMSGYLSS
jgi:tryptophan synthase beta subunit